MNPFLPGVDERAVYKDAMFFSVHKFIGGVQTPGLYYTCGLCFIIFWYFITTSVLITAVVYSILLMISVIMLSIAQTV
jgi:hypothetical protein